MWRRLVTEQETLISIGIFGVLVMLADAASDLGWTGWAVAVRIVGILLLTWLVGYTVWQRRRIRAFPVPLMFTTETDREVARCHFERFVDSHRLPLKTIERCTSVPRSDLLIVLKSDPRSKAEPDWEEAWRDLLQEWERDVDSRIARFLGTNEYLSYHIFPHVWLPLAFALGASVGLRRAIVLYHRQQDRFYRVLDLTNPRCLFEPPGEQTPAPDKVPPDFETLPSGDRLALHIGITDRHPFPQFEAYHDHAHVVNAAVVYRQALEPESDWLPYVQHLHRETQPLIGKYPQVDICLAMPAPIAFALGMALSRTPKIRICDYQNAQYIPVFALEKIEKRLPFD
jgi:hypothetical protein